MKIEFLDNEGYRILIGNGEKIDLQAIQNEVGKADFSIVSEFDGSIIMTAEEVRSEILKKEEQK